MSNVELIAAALSAGARAGITDTASAVVQDAYAGMKRLLRPWVRGEARTALDADETEPAFWEARLGPELTASGADSDEQVRLAASRLLALTAATGTGTGTYRVDISQAKGVQVGDYNTQTNHF